MAFPVRHRKSKKGSLLWKKIFRPLARCEQTSRNSTRDWSRKCSRRRTGAGRSTSESARPAPRFFQIASDGRFYGRASDRASAAARASRHADSACSTPSTPFLKRKDAAIICGVCKSEDFLCSVVTKPRTAWRNRGSGLTFMDFAKSLEIDSVPAKRASNTSDASFSNCLLIKTRAKGKTGHGSSRIGSIQRRAMLESACLMQFHLD